MGLGISDGILVGTVEIWKYKLGWKIVEFFKVDGELVEYLRYKREREGGTVKESENRGRGDNEEILNVLKE